MKNAIMIPLSALKETVELNDVLHITIGHPDSGSGIGMSFHDGGVGQTDVASAKSDYSIQDFDSALAEAYRAAKEIGENVFFILK